MTGARTGGALGMALATALASALAATPIAAQVDSVSRAQRRPEPPDSTVAPAPARDRWLGADKVRHFVLAGLVQGVGFGAATAAGVRQRPAMVSAGALTAALSVGKELYDGRRGGRASVRDLAWDAAGAAAWGVLLVRSGR